MSALFMMMIVIIWAKFLILRMVTFGNSVCLVGGYSWLGDKLTSHFGVDMHDTSSIIQNEILDIMAEIVLGRIVNNVNVCSG